MSVYSTRQELGNETAVRPHAAGFIRMEIFY